MSQTKEDNLSSVGRTALGLLVLGFSSALFGALVVGPRLGEQLVPAASALERRPVSDEHPAGSEQEPASVATEGASARASAEAPDLDAATGPLTSDQPPPATGDSTRESESSGANPSLEVPRTTDAEVEATERTVSTPPALTGTSGASLSAAGSDKPRPAVVADEATERERIAEKARDEEATRRREAEARAESERAEEQRRERAAELARREREKERERRLALERERERAAELERERLAREREREREKRLAAEQERRREDERRREEEQRRETARRETARREAARKPRSEETRRTAADSERTTARERTRTDGSERTERKTATGSRNAPATLPAIQPEVAEDQGVFKVRVGRFKSREEAEKARDALNRSAGKEAFLVRDGESFRLQVGAYKDRANADKLAGELQGSGSRSDKGSDN